MGLKMWLLPTPLLPSHDAALLLLLAARAAVVEPPAPIATGPAGMDLMLGLLLVLLPPLSGATLLPPPAA
jgi:hypothetical protein